MMNFAQYFATRLRALSTPQSAPIQGSGQVPNSAAGYAWAVTPWQRLDRFLVLGTEGGTYYVGERQLTVESAQAVAECIAQGGPSVVARVVEVSEAGRAPRNDPALFVLAMAAGMGDAETRAAALDALPRVARTGTHLLHWLGYVQAFRGWGRGVRRAVGRWYTARPARELAYQLLKYPQRDGWSHRDALRLAHPRPADAEQGALLRRAVTGRLADDAPETDAIRLVRAVAELHADAEIAPALAAETVREHRLTREMVPTQLLASPVVWEALLEEMPLWPTAAKTPQHNPGSVQIRKTGTANATAQGAYTIVFGTNTEDISFLVSNNGSSATSGWAMFYSHNAGVVAYISVSCLSVSNHVATFLGSVVASSDNTIVGDDAYWQVVDGSPDQSSTVSLASSGQGPSCTSPTEFDLVNLSNGSLTVTP